MQISVRYLTLAKHSNRCYLFYDGEEEASTFIPSPTDEENDILIKIFMNATDQRPDQKAFWFCCTPADFFGSSKATEFWPLDSLVRASRNVNKDAFLMLVMVGKGWRLDPARRDLSTISIRHLLSPDSKKLVACHDTHLFATATVLQSLPLQVGKSYRTVKAKFHMTREYYQELCATFTSTPFDPTNELRVLANHINHYDPTHTGYLRVTGVRRTHLIEDMVLLFNKDITNPRCWSATWSGHQPNDGLGPGVGREMFGLFWEKLEEEGWLQGDEYLLLSGKCRADERMRTAICLGLVYSIVNKVFPFKLHPALLLLLSDSWSRHYAFQELSQPGSVTAAIAVDRLTFLLTIEPEPSQT